MCSGKTCWSHSLFLRKFPWKDYTVGLAWKLQVFFDARSILLSPCCPVGCQLITEALSLRSEVTWKRSGPNWHGSLAGEKNRCLDLTIAPQNRDLYQTLGAHNRTTKSSNFGDSKQDFICDMFFFIQHGLTRVWLCFIPQDDRSLLGFCVFSFLLTHFTFGVCNLISKFGIAIAFYLQWWCLEMVVCIAQVSHSISGFGKYKWLFTMRRTEENGQLTCWKSDGSRTEGRVEADSTQKSGQCFFGSRGYWTSTKQDVLEAWLYLATFHFLPAISNLDSLRQFTLKVWIYTCERLPVTTTEHQTPCTCLNIFKPDILDVLLRPLTCFPSR